MEILLIIIFGALTYALYRGGESYFKKGYDTINFFYISAALVAALNILIIISIIFFDIPKIATAYIVDDKINMYQETNAQIEERIGAAIEQYKGYEKGTLKELKGNTDVITLVTMYPELKTDNLISKQIEVYVDNNAKIQELREEKIEMSKTRWWVYFGR